MSRVLTVKASKLIELLSEIKPVATKQIAENTIPTVTFDKNKIIANNDISEYIVSFENDFDSCSVNYNKLLELLKNLPFKRKITLEQKKRKLVIYHKSKQNQNRYSTIPTISGKENYYSIEKPKSLRDIPSDFAKGISKCIPILPKEALRFDLELLMINGDKIISSDDARMSQYIMEEEIRASKFFLSKLHIDIFLSGVFDKYGVDENAINFVGPSSDVVMSLPYEVNYPDIEDSVFDTDNSQIVRVKRKKLISEIDRTIIFAEGASDIIKKANLSISGNKYSILAKNEEGRNKENGRVLSKVNDEIDCRFNPVYLRQGLQSFNEENIDILFSGFGSGYRIIMEVDNFKFIMATYPN